MGRAVVDLREIFTISW